LGFKKRDLAKKERSIAFDEYGEWEKGGGSKYGQTFSKKRVLDKFNKKNGTVNGKGLTIPPLGTRI